MRNWLDILAFLTERNCSDTWQGDGLLTRIIPMTNPNHKDVPKTFGMLSATADGVGSRPTGDSILSVATIVADSHEILLFPLKRGKIRMTETMYGVRASKEVRHE